jgi:peroxiredoxin
MANKVLRVPRVGEIAPDFRLPATDGGVVRLSESPKPVAIVFLRHLA